MTIKITEENIYKYESEIQNYIVNKFWFYDNDTIDNIEINWDKIVVNGVFRCEEPEDWDIYEADGFPDDVDQVEITIKELENYINS